MTTEQAKIWNGTAGTGWVEAQELTDRMFRPFEFLLRNGIRAGAEVLDVGCGTGSTTLAAARHTGPEGSCTGVDISEPMIAAARLRAAEDGVAATFIVADAQRHAFTPRSFDSIISRFGIMFFDDPEAAFSNLRHAAKPGAQLRVIAFRSATENDFMTLAERTAAPLLPGLPPRRPEGPGQFAFADKDHVRSILQTAGWTGVSIEPLDVECSLPANSLPQYITRLGPVARALPDADPETRTRVIETVSEAFHPYVRGGDLRFTPACWMISAS